MASQEPKLEVPTIYKAEKEGLCKGISQQNMARNMVLSYLHFRILKFPLIKFMFQTTNQDIQSPIDIPPKIMYEWEKPHW